MSDIYKPIPAEIVSLVIRRLPQYYIREYFEADERGVIYLNLSKYHNTPLRRQLKLESLPSKEAHNLQYGLQALICVAILILTLCFLFTNLSVTQTVLQLLLIMALGYAAYLHRQVNRLRTASINEALVVLDLHVTQ